MSNQDKNAQAPSEPSFFKNPERAKNVLGIVIGVGILVLFWVSLYANAYLK